MGALGDINKKLKITLDYDIRGDEKVKTNINSVNSSLDEQKNRLNKLNRSILNQRNEMKRLSMARTEMVGAGLKREPAKIADDLRDRKMNLSESLIEKSELQDNIKATKRNEANSKIAAQSDRRKEISQQGFFKTLRLSNKEMNDFNDNGGKMEKKTGKMAQSLRNATQGARGFKMELLGMMFFGMSLQRTMKGLISTSLDWFGVNDVLSAALGLLFMPIAEKVLDWALWFLDVVDSMSETTKNLINKIVGWVAIFGALLMVIGTVGLGVGALISGFTGLLWALGLAAAAFLIFNAAFSDTESGLKAIEGAADGAAGRLVQLGILPDGVVQRIYGTLKSGAGRIYHAVIGWLDAAKLAWDTKGKSRFMEFGKTAMQWISDTFTENFPIVWETIKTFTKSILTKLDEMFPQVKVWSKALWEKITNWWDSDSQQVYGAVANFVNGSIQALGKFFDNNMDLIASIGVGVIKNMWKAMKATFMKLMEEEPMLAILLGGLVGGKVAGPIGALVGAGMAGAGILGGKLANNAMDFDSNRGDNIGYNVHAEQGMFQRSPISANDFILTSGGQLIKPSSQDTIIGTKKPGELGGKGNITFAPVINVDANISKDTDVRRLADDLKRYWVSDFERLTQRRGN